MDMYTLKKTAPPDTLLSHRSKNQGYEGKKVERAKEGMLYTFKAFFDRMTIPTAEVPHDSHRQYRFRRRLSPQRTNR